MLPVNKLSVVFQFTSRQTFAAPLTALGSIRSGFAKSRKNRTRWENASDTHFEQLNTVREN